MQPMLAALCLCLGLILSPVLTERASAQGRSHWASLDGNAELCETMPALQTQGQSSRRDGPYCRCIAEAITAAERKGTSMTAILQLIPSVRDRCSRTASAQAANAPAVDGQWKSNDDPQFINLGWVYSSENLYYSDIRFACFAGRANVHAYLNVFETPVGQTARLRLTKGRATMEFSGIAEESMDAPSITALIEKSDAFWAFLRQPGPLVIEEQTRRAYPDTTLPALLDRFQEACTGGLPDTLADTSGQCINYGDTVTLEGDVVHRTFPGRPNYESVADGDEPERVALLRLRHPVCFEGGGEEEPYEGEVSELHIVRGDGLRTPDGPARLTGTFFHAHTGHHHTDVLINLLETVRP